MNDFLKLVLSALHVSCDRPVFLDGFHIFFLCLIFLVTYLLVKGFRRAPHFIYRVILFVFWVITVVMEVLRQMYYGLSYAEAEGVFRFVLSWRNLPLQLCAMQLYVLPAVIFSKRGRFHRAMALFMASYSFVAGLAVLVNPDTIMTTNAYINVQGLVHHGIQFIMGAYILAHEREEFEGVTFLHTTGVFTLMTLFVTVLNELSYPIFTQKGIHPFNLFFISRQQPGDIDFLTPLIEGLPYPIFWLLYVLVVTLGAYLLYFIASKIFSKMDERSDFKAR